MKEDYKERFIADALDLLQSLEKAALALEDNTDDKNCIEEIFRSLHTLKGAGAMYGFPEIEHLMHLFENVFEEIRAGKLIINTRLINLTLEVADITKNYLQAKAGDKQEMLEKIINLESVIKQFNTSSNIEEKKQQINDKPDNIEKTLYIRFIQEKDFKKRGIKHDIIFKELQTIGKVISIPHKNSEKADTIWDIFVLTKADITEIEDVFIFAFDLTQIHILAEKNLFLHDDFNAYLKNCSSLKKPAAENELFTIVNNILNKNASNSKADADNNLAENKTVFLKIDSDKIDEQMNLLSELVTAKAELSLIVQQEKYVKLLKVSETIDKLTNRFRKNILNIRLLPLKNLYIRFLRLTRDISSKLDKDIEITASGLENELDVNIIDCLETPLTHIIRNSIDHGIESPEIRIKKGKPGKGKIEINAFHHAAHIIIEISDDGTGIDKDKVKEKAIAKGIISKDTELSEKNIYDLIFLPGFSTAQNLYEVSGRGVGMDIVKKAINNLRGQIEIRSEKEKGTTVSIKLPLTLSIIDTMLVKSGYQFFSIPLSVISHCTQIMHKQIEDNSTQQLNIDNQRLPYIYLREEFNIQGTPPEKEKIVVVKTANKNTGFIVDSVIGEHQAVIKPLEEYFINQEYFSGASILADGNLSVILDTNKLINDKIKSNK